ncbi:MAG: hypothetical protein EZS28_034194 [Streblomastix strix]|uniref:G-patch domain-containing protein n=1 Tax=Streblomastix strix TaxID=222440 RepID=A0A5J4UI76_9EUKA|nr:MAG: hypothetical protein EZS28_034194 [Streblomastix strix]
MSETKGEQTPVKMTPMQVLRQTKPMKPKTSSKLTQLPIAQFIIQDQHEHNEGYDEEELFPPDGPDVYDPNFPDDYIQLVEERAKIEEEKHLRDQIEERDRAERALLLEEKSKQAQIDSQTSEQEEEDEDEIWERKVKQRQEMRSGMSNEAGKAEDANILKGEEFAKSFMKKFGFTEGKGLGKEEQGIKTAIGVEQIGDNAGIIVQLKEKQ